ncbi:MAG: hypothetical protein QOE54_2862 [Streptosporangiaceae bacterium]|jgi:hypothetical protein|nr:hypothetical protein [Streptosporangiaceae bacterium]
MAEPRIEQLPQDDWFDQDLLTRDEAAGRLAEKIAEITGRLAELGEAGGAVDAEPETAELNRRLAALQNAHDALVN